MAMKKSQLQQGDVTIRRIKHIPANAAEDKNAVIAEGEGHHLHRIASPAAVTMYLLDGIKYARVHQETELEHVTLDGRHGEHNPITLPPGDYQFGQVREYDYLSEMSRPVID